MRNVKLVLEYDGTDLVGWQRQARGRSVQGEIESVLAKILQEQVSVIGAGRTDSGVHARGQVANFRIESARTLDEMRGALIGLLPADIVVLDVAEVPVDFHARFRAISRRYSYTIARQPTALLRHCVWHTRYTLDRSLLDRVAASILGTHDFRSFCKSESDVDHHRCTVMESQWTENESVLMFTITADRFLHGMVRALVGTMVDVARGYITTEDFQSIMERRDRTAAGPAAPARGLVLEEVRY